MTSAHGERRAHGRGGRKQAWGEAALINCFLSLFIPVMFEIFQDAEQLVKRIGENVFCIQNLSGFVQPFSHLWGHDSDIYPLLGPVGAAVTRAGFSCCGSQTVTCSELGHKSLHAGRHRALHVKRLATQSAVDLQNSREALRCLEPLPRSPSHPVPSLPDNEAHTLLHSAVPQNL